MYKLAIVYVLSIISILLLAFVCIPLVLMGILTSDQLWLYVWIGFLASTGIWCIILTINLAILCIKELMDKDNE